MCWSSERNPLISQIKNSDFLKIAKWTLMVPWFQDLVPINYSQNPLRILKGFKILLFLRTENLSSRLKICPRTDFLERTGNQNSYPKNDRETPQTFFLRPLSIGWKWYQNRFLIFFLGELLKKSSSSRSPKICPRTDFGIFWFMKSVLGSRGPGSFSRDFIFVL